MLKISSKFFIALILLIGIFGLVLKLMPYLKQLAYQQSPLTLKNLTGEYQSNQQLAYFQNQTISLLNLNSDIEPKSVMGDSTGTNKWIEVDLTNQRLYAMENGEKVMDFLVSTGKWGRTPTGEFQIWIKLRFTTMSGGSKALNTYYYLPNVPYTMFFYNKDYPKWVGYGIHGTYWHDNFGHPMSHGCINMKNEEVEQLYYWAQPDLPDGKKSVSATADNPGTKIYIYGVAPKE